MSEPRLLTTASRVAIGIFAMILLVVGLIGVGIQGLGLMDERHVAVLAIPVGSDTVYVKHMVWGSSGNRQLAVLSRDPGHDFPQPGDYIESGSSIAFAFCIDGEALHVWDYRWERPADERLAPRVVFHPNEHAGMYNEVYDSAEHYGVGRISLSDGPLETPRQAPQVVAPRLCRPELLQASR